MASGVPAAFLTEIKDAIARATEIDRQIAIRLEADYLSRPGSLPDYMREAWKVPFPTRPLVWNWHIDMIAEVLEAWYKREIRRVVINVPPRCMKSLECSVFFPSWVWTHDEASAEWSAYAGQGLIIGAQHQFLTLSHGERLATRDSLKTRRLIKSRWYQERWGSRFRLAGDQSEKRRYENDHNGHRIAQSMTAGLTGEGGDSTIMDDPHDAEKAQSERENENTIDAYDGKVSTRLNDPDRGGELIIMQRLGQKDLSGHVLANGGWEHVCLPMRYEPKRFVSSIGLKDPRTKPGDLLWPSRFSEATVGRLEVTLGAYRSGGQLQQDPTPTEGGILKKKWWRRWPDTRPFPEFHYVLQSWDTAFTGEELGRGDKFNPKNARSARTTWGLFKVPPGMPREGSTAVMVLERFAEWVEWFELRKEARDAFDEWAPDVLLIEAKASGISLIQDLRRAGVPALEYNPDRDKVARCYAVQPLFESGMVYAPNTRWADEVIEECAMAPRGLVDLADSTTQALLRMRALFYLEHPDDEDDDADADGYDDEREAAYG